MTISDQIARIDKMGFPKSWRQKYSFNQDQARYKQPFTYNHQRFDSAKLTAFRFDRTFENIENKRIGTEWTSYVTEAFKQRCLLEEHALIAKLKQLELSSEKSNPYWGFGGLKLYYSIFTQETELTKNSYDYEASRCPLEIDAYISGKRLYIFMCISVTREVNPDWVHRFPSFITPYIDEDKIQDTLKPLRDQFNEISKKENETQEEAAQV